jgi:hypothetical protein
LETALLFCRLRDGAMTPKDMDFIEAKNSAAREIALAIGVPPMLLGIPGDATYSNYAEAQRALWRQTVLPVVNRMAKGFSNWLSPAFSLALGDSPSSSRPPSAGPLLELRPDLDQVEALAPEREALWTRLEAASFLTDDEKRAAAGYAAKDQSPAALATTTVKFNPHHDDAGRFTTADGVGGGAGNNALAGGSGNDRLAQANDPKRYTVNLVEEDARGGHAVRDHVSKSDAELIGVVEASVIKGMFVDLYKDAQGSFLSIESANDFTNQVLSRNKAQVDAVASGAIDEAWLPERFGYPTGKEAFRAGAKEPVYIRPTYAVGVLIRHDTRSDKGYRVHTAYPVNEKAK